MLSQHPEQPIGDTAVAAVDEGELPTIKTSAATLGESSERPTMLAPGREGPRRDNNHTLVLLGYLVFILLTYAVCLLIPYAYDDDYVSMAHIHVYDLKWFIISGGRPLAGIFETTQFKVMTTVGQAGYFRLTAMIGLALFAWVLYRVLLSERVDRWAAILVPLALATTPVFQELVGFVTLAGMIYSAIAAGLSAIVVQQALRHDDLRDRALRLAAAVASLLIALLFYEPTAMVFCAFLAVDLFVIDKPLSVVVKRLAAFLGVLGLALVLKFVEAQALPRILYGEAPIRTDFVTDYVARVQWWLRFPLNTSLNFYSVVPSPRIALVVAALITGGLIVHVRGHWYERLGKLAIAFALVPLSFLPNMIVATPITDFRTQYGQVSLLVIYAMIALMAYTSLWVSGQAEPESRRRPVHEHAALRWVSAPSPRHSWWLAAICAQQYVRWAGIHSLPAAVRKLCCALRWYTPGPPDQLRLWKPSQQLVPALLALLVLGTGLIAARNLTMYVALPSFEEYQMMVRQLRDGGIDRANSVYLIPASRDQGNRDMEQWGEFFGMPSTYRPWVVRPMTLIALRDINPTYATSKTIIIGSASEAANPPPGSVVVNMLGIKYYYDLLSWPS